MLCEGTVLHASNSGRGQRLNVAILVASFLVQMELKLQCKMEMT